MPYQWEAHEALTQDVKELSNLHHPNSCSRPVFRGAIGARDDEPWVDWPLLKAQAWTFVQLPYDGDAALDFVCPAWWNATACECECGSCSVLFKQCPIGFMLFRALALLCDARGNRAIRLHELVRKQWGCGLLQLAKLKLGFADILHSGWPYFGVLSRVAEQVRIDGVTEATAVTLIARRRPEAHPPGATTLCQAVGWRDDLEYQDSALAALEKNEPLPLQRSLDAAASSACPLQRAVAHAATADWLLQPAAAAQGEEAAENWFSPAGLQELERTIQRVESDVRAWASIGGEACASSRPYFFELLSTDWPVWRLLHRVGLRLAGAFALACARQAGGGGDAAAGEALQQLPLVCPACPCSAQGEWAVEARYIGEYTEILSEALFRRAARSLPLELGPLAARRARRLAAAPALPWQRRWEALKEMSSPSRSAPSAPPDAPVPEQERREAFATVLFSRGAAFDQVLLHAEAIRTLAFSARQLSLRQRPFLVVVDWPLPEVVAATLRADGLTVLEVGADTFRHLGRAGAAYGAGRAAAAAASEGDLELHSWWLERGIAPTAVKLAIWNLTDYDCVVFLDADTLLLDAVDELFELETFASGLNPYSTHGLNEFRSDGQSHYFQTAGINTGVMVLQPSAEIAELMAEQMTSGIHDLSLISEHLGQSDQPWLDAFWLHHSRRHGVARFGRLGRARRRGLRFLGCDQDFSVSWGEIRQPRRAPSCASSSAPGCGRRGSGRARRGLLRPPNPSEGHCLLPLEYDFFADYKAVRTHVWYEARERRAAKPAESGLPPRWRNSSDAAWAVRQYVEGYRLLGLDGLKILHWPGELRKPWQRWHRSVRSPWDQAWWAAHGLMCRQSSAPCHLRCAA